MLWKHLAFGQFKNWAMLWNKNGKNWEDRERRCREREIGWFRLERKKLCNNKNNYHEKQRLQWWCSENLTANTFFPSHGLSSRCTPNEFDCFSNAHRNSSLLAHSTNYPQCDIAAGAAIYIPDICIYWSSRFVLHCRCLGWSEAFNFGYTFIHEYTTFIFYLW